MDPREPGQYTNQRADVAGSTPDHAGRPPQQEAKPVRTVRAPVFEESETPVEPGYGHGV